MRFLCDHDVWFVTVQLLRAESHDVVRVSEIGLAQTPDSEILAHANFFSENMAGGG